MITELIDKQDTSEIVRDRIAQILADEAANQYALAQTDGKPNPEDWKLRIFAERSNPWDMFNALSDEETVDETPIVNVTYSGSVFPEGRGNTVSQQASETMYNVDILAYAEAADNPDGGFLPGDSAAAFAAQRATRLVRNILMAAENTYLGLRGVVWNRWIASITQFQPEFDSTKIQQMIGCRISFRVVFNEFSPQIVPVTLEGIDLELKRAETGEVLATAQFDFP